MPAARQTGHARDGARAQTGTHKDQTTGQEQARAAAQDPPGRPAAAHPLSHAKQRRQRIMTQPELIPPAALPFNLITETEQDGERIQQEINRSRERAESFERAQISLFPNPKQGRQQ